MRTDPNRSPFDMFYFDSFVHDERGDSLLATQEVIDLSSNDTLLDEDEAQFETASTQSLSGLSPSHS